jgi:hypothetical protein
VFGAGRVGGAPDAAPQSHAAVGRRGREVTRHTSRRPGVGPQAGRHPVRDLARRRRLRTASFQRGLIASDSRGLLSDSCPETVIARRAARAERPRKTDCDPSTDFNLCAVEREYSIETARRPARTSSTCPHLRAASRARGLRPSLTRPLTPSSSRGGLQVCDAGASRPGRDLRLIAGPLHTRPVGHGLTMTASVGVRRAPVCRATVILTPLRH